MDKLRNVSPAPDQSETISPFVTISRQAGAGGHTLANVMLSVFGEQADTDLFEGWQVFDQNLCQHLATDPLYAGSLSSLLADEYHSPTQDFFHQVVRSTLDQDAVMARVFQLVRSVALIGKAIIVGRAGSQVTRDVEGGVRLRIVAPEQLRIERIMAARDLTPREASSEIRKLDGHRARLLKTHFRIDVDDPLGYDAVWNTGSATALEIAEATAAMLRRRTLSDGEA